MAAGQRGHRLPERLFRAGLGPTARADLGLLDWIMYVLYVTFVIDYIARLALADQRTRWFFRNLLDLAIVALPFLRSLRIL